MLEFIEQNPNKKIYTYYDRGYNITLGVDRTTSITKAEIDLSCDGRDTIKLEFECLRKALEYFKRNL